MKFGNMGITKVNYTLSGVPIGAIQISWKIGKTKLLKKKKKKLKLISKKVRTGRL